MITNVSTPSLTASFPIMFLSSSLIMPCNLVCPINLVRLTAEGERGELGSAHFPSGQNESLKRIIVSLVDTGPEQVPEKDISQLTFHVTRTRL